MTNIAQLDNISDLTFSYRRGETWVKNVSLAEALAVARATKLPLTRGWGKLPVPDGDIVMPRMLLHSPIYVGDDGVVFATRTS